jgi:hypothetical protein
MKLVTKMAVIATLASFMFAGVNLTWGNSYADDGAGSTFRLGYGTTTTLGMSYTWWEGAGTGWATNLSTALDYEMTGTNDFDITVNLGFGF